MGRKKQLPWIQLLNVPDFRQGSFDSLCTYCTAAMMLSALFPGYTWNFGGAARRRVTKALSDDPIIRNYSQDDHRKILAKWFYMGEYVEQAVRIMNRIMKSDGERTRFGYHDETAHDNTFTEVIVDSINVGLPVMLGWNTHDYGDHAVLVTGYWEGRERWLLVNDPSGGADQISWDSLKDQRTAKFSIGLCQPETHVGYRPMKRCTAASGSGTTVSRWTKDGFRPIEQDFD